jgi:hypothetical protein
MKMGASKFAAPRAKMGHPMKMGAAPKIHPAASATRVRLPDTGSIGADPSPIVPNAGKI